MTGEGEVILMGALNGVTKHADTRGTLEKSESVTTRGEQAAQI